MNKPNNWENTQAFGEFEPLELGGHICKILKVEETTSRNGRDMIKIALDIAEGEQKDYYRNQFDKDIRDSKKWGCTVYQLIEDKDGNTSRGFKTFINAVEKSNSGFNGNLIWNDKFSSFFKDKLVGGVFGREQYENQNGDLKWSTKCVQFRDIETIKKGVDIPEDRYLDGGNRNNQQSGASEFASIADDDLPF